ncbi:MAG: HepT-like ribonuclease domain-containing protein, partial [candidate division WOR-3 bacterium]
IADYFIYNTLAMECFQAANALIEIAEYLVLQKKLGMPSSYREIFELLNTGGLIDSQELENFKRIVFLRNLIAHEYYKISTEELLEIAKLLDQARNFVERVKINEQKNQVNSL